MLQKFSCRFLVTNFNEKTDQNINFASDNVTSKKFKDNTTIMKRLMKNRFKIFSRYRKFYLN